MQVCSDFFWPLLASFTSFSSFSSFFFSSRYFGHFFGMTIFSDFWHTLGTSLIFLKDYIELMTIIEEDCTGCAKITDNAIFKPSSSKAKEIDPYKQV